MIARPIPPGASGGTYIPPEDTFEIHTAVPAVRFVTQAAQPPSNLYVAMGEALQVNAASSQANESVTVTYRLLLANGSLHSGQFVMQVTANRAINTHSEQLAEGYLLSVAVVATVATTRGQTFARIFVTKTALGVGVPSYVLMSDYVTTQITAGFPNGRVLAPSEGPGWTRIAVAGPALGSDFAITVPTNARWGVLTGSGRFTASAAAGNRQPAILFTTAGAISFELRTKGVVAASQFGFVNVAPGSWDTLTVGTVIFMTMPIPLRVMLMPTDVITSSTLNLDAGDQWTVAFEVEEWLDNI